MRRAALEILQRIFERGNPFDEALASSGTARMLEDRDRGFASAIAYSVLRHKGEIDAIVASFMSRPLPRKSGSTALVLSIGVAQLLFMDVAPHAAIDLSVRLARLDRGGTHFTGLINAVLRKVAADGKSKLLNFDSARLNLPEWLWERWVRSYGEPVVRRIAGVHALEAPIDVTVASDAAGWAKRLNGTLLPTGSIRLSKGAGPVDQLPGFVEGGWWVQDVAATLPALLCGNVRGKKVLDLCAAPGGKTMQFCAAGARVTAVDVSELRLERVHENLQRQKFTAEVLARDVLALDYVEEFDVVLLDAPCSATGTIRRHPELPYIRDEKQVTSLAKLQTRMLRKAATYVMPGGLLIYCSCSLEPEEGELQIEGFLSRNPDFQVVPVVPSESGIDPQFSTAKGYLRTLPAMAIGSDKGLDGFFAARLQKAFTKSLANH